MDARIDESLVRDLIASQFPQWAGLEIRPMSPQGWDNRSFRVGRDLVARLPTASEYASQCEKEHAWLPRLAPNLPLEIPTLVAKGAQDSRFPFPWSVRRFIHGEVATRAAVGDLPKFAADLAGFLRTLHALDATNGPPPGPHNFHRGGALATYDEEVRAAIARLGSTIDVNAAARVWEAALPSSWNRAPVWVHGDISPGNLLVRQGRLAAVIDFGMLGAGDPACDLAIAWTLLEGEARTVFRSCLPVDAATWTRGRAWTLWKALIVAAGSPTNAIEYAHPVAVIEAVLADHWRYA